MGAGAMLSLPFLERFVESGAFSFTAIRGINLISYVLNTYAVSVPGRIDGQAQSSESGNVKDTSSSPGGYASSNKEIRDLAPDTGKTLVAPSGWAFSIWGPIFFGEFVFVVSQFFVDEAAPVAAVIKKASIPFSMAQVFQTLWCAAFRPKYKGNLMYISTSLLAAVAFSMSKAHAAFTVSPLARLSYSNLQYMLYFLPMSLHFGWTTAASLVNLNGAVAKKESTSSKVTAFVGHLSVVAATAAGVFVSLNRSAPVFGAVISWALFAVADGMKTRLESSAKKTDDNDEARPGLYGAYVQKYLSTVGAWTSAAVSAFSAYSLFFSSAGSTGYDVTP
eukprot:CAMPEP_0195520694 /NCGR_PEP_ID=MMETSP0794_2-20130614/17442_1 /TAXON_ID=515487 /ORGANISM="Stephanopyxis turris, Strain CCMP 815" /LENGTH=333 /DNA_ID=CAMNT_0040650107 /DNA_START=176 /DNA_END=1177 /DNA_ORIENTATION=+